MNNFENAVFELPARWTPGKRTMLVKILVGGGGGGQDVWGMQMWRMNNRSVKPFFSSR